MKNNPLIIYHHLGLGDHIICNGLVRHFAKLHSCIYLFVKPHNKASVDYMFRDLSNIILIEGDDNLATATVAKNPNISLVVGFDFLLKEGRGIKFDRAFYNQVGLNFNDRWTKFYVQRNEEVEISLFKTLNPNNEPFAFIHDDKSRGFSINEENITLFKIFPQESLTDNIFDYCLLLERAQEIHCMDSAFKLLADSLSVSGKLFHHAYVRGYGNSNLSSSKLNWRIL